ncbi:hypothetical protein LOZ58_006634 [Ophidiomyces ophidiicola]|nr:hypothetical protein LOZ65_006068 [Ophidiomyces ophidiicola]KAI1955823.1 hypothetical protein LOZ58_006634 [Ophidiomyces ophidiicola]
MATQAVLATRSTPWQHLYRSLLRECTYLPDPIATEYMRRYIRSGFRESASAGRGHRLKPIEEFHRHRRFRKLLSLLHRANEGYLRPLERVLLLSYGRLGKRRRELMSPLIPPSTQKQTFDDDWEAPSALLALVKDQCRHRQIVELKFKRNIKAFEPPIPKENAWGRPTPVKRRANIRRKWYQLLINSVFPVLPDQEWKTLQGLASGREPWTLPKRRKAPKDLQPKSLLSPEFIVFGPPKGPTFAPYQKGRPHYITRKLMANLWKTVCTLTPTMAWNETKCAWSIKWGFAEFPQQRSSQKLDPQKAMTLFEGVHPNTGMRLPLK